jgi:hypothetical protein
MFRTLDELLADMFSCASGYGLALSGLMIYKNVGNK